ncbi:MAG: hypothetical protein LBP75_08425 [Planctomycetota bacterium]|jgi:hypothetical protein|nr:hypothetical protein [Planctomycetota bacterium]
MNFDIDDIHQVRLELVERRAKMSPAEAKADEAKRVNDFLGLSKEVKKKRAIRRFSLA